MLLRSRVIALTNLGVHDARPPCGVATLPHQPFMADGVKRVYSSAVLFSPTLQMNTEKNSKRLILDLKEFSWK